MRALSAADVLRVWELALTQGPDERAFTILAAAFPDRSREELMDLPLGARDRLLFGVREHLFGGRLSALVQCPGCGATLELTLETVDIVGRGNGAPSSDSPPPYGITLRNGDAREGETRLVFRLPSGADLIALQGISDPGHFRRALAERCLLEGGAGDSLAEDALSDDALAALGAEMLVRDPQAEVLLDLACPSCDTAWQAYLDISTYLWRELEASAGRILREVDTLARAYGWAEGDILALSPGRRQAYLELAWTS